MGIHGYVFIDQSDFESWLSRLVRSGHWRQEPARDISATFYDTFDWRLYRKETILALSRETDRQCLCSRSFSGELLARLDPAAEPRFVRDLPPGKLRRQLQPLAEMRRLLPLVTVHSRQHRLALLNGDGKTVLRLLISADRLAEDPRRAKYPLPVHLRLLPVRGYPAAQQRLEAQFRAEAVLRPAGQNPLEEALAAIGRRPADYSSKLELQLQPEQAARQALGSILSTLFATLRVNLDGIRADIDSEFLHDFRVAVRRTRSALGQLKGLLPPVETEPYREEFAWLGLVTGPTRDLDVYLLRFDDYRRLLPQVQQSDLDPFQRFLEQRRRQEQQAMIAELATPRFTRLLVGWQGLLEQDREPDPGLPAAGLPIRAVADRRIRKLFKRCLAEGRAIIPDSPAEALHEMRKTCKKLRYLLEFFRSLYPPDAMATLVKALKGLQNNLGDVQDLEVQGEAMRSFGLQMAEQNLAPPATLRAMGLLAEGLQHRQERAREEFYRRFAVFSEAENCRLFHQLFGRPKKEAAEPRNPARHRNKSERNEDGHRDRT
jgi:CHAD domain-containing protein